VDPPLRCRRPAFRAAGVGTGQHPGVRHREDRGRLQGPLRHGRLSARQDAAAYPAVLLTTGANDPRVAPWQAGKMTARLQAATSSGKPILLRVDYDAGHSLGSTKTQRDEELADEEAFLFWQLGVPEVQQ